MMATELNAANQAGGWRRGKEWRRSRRQAALATGPAGRTGRDHGAAQ